MLKFQWLQEKTTSLDETQINDTLYYKNMAQPRLKPTTFMQKLMALLADKTFTNHNTIQNTEIIPTQMHEDRH